MWEARCIQRKLIKENKKHTHIKWDLIEKVLMRKIDKLIRELAVLPNLTISSR